MLFLENVDPEYLASEDRRKYSGQSLLHMLQTKHKSFNNS